MPSTEKKRMLFLFLFITMMGSNITAHHRLTITNNTNQTVIISQHPLTLHMIQPQDSCAIDSETMLQLYLYQHDKFNAGQYTLLGLLEQNETLPRDCFLKWSDINTRALQQTWGTIFEWTPKNRLDRYQHYQEQYSTLIAAEHNTKESSKKLSGQHKPNQALMQKKQELLLQKKQNRKLYPQTQVNLDALSQQLAQQTNQIDTKSLRPTRSKPTFTHQSNRHKVMTT